MMNEHELVKSLRTQGVDATVVNECDELYDGEIRIEGTDFHLQVGCGFICLQKDNLRTCGPHEAYKTQGIRAWTSKTVGNFFEEIGSLLKAKG